MIFFIRVDQRFQHQQQKIPQQLDCFVKTSQKAERRIRSSKGVWDYLCFWFWYRKPCWWNQTVCQGEEVREREAKEVDDQQIHGWVRCFSPSKYFYVDLSPPAILAHHLLLCLHSLVLTISLSWGRTSWLTVLLCCVLTLVSPCSFKWATKHLRRLAVLGMLSTLASGNSCARCTGFSIWFAFYLLIII